MPAVEVEDMIRGHSIIMLSQNNQHPFSLSLTPHKSSKLLDFRIL